MPASSTAVAAQAAPAPGSGAGESSADEITPIVSHERGNGKGKRYDSAVQERSHDRSDDSAGSGSTTTRRRKQQRPPPARRKGLSFRENHGVEDDDTHNQHQQQEEESRTADRKTGGGRSKPDRRARSTSSPSSSPDSEHQRTFSLKRLAEKYGSIELDNKGAVARDHLALERTFLAWLRTSLSFASIGIAVTQLFRLNTTLEERDGLHPAPGLNKGVRLRQLGKPLGATFLGVAIVVLVMGGRRYFESQYWIVRGKFPASRGSIFLLTCIAVALIVISLVLVCVVDPSVFER